MSCNTNTTAGHSNGIAESEELNLPLNLFVPAPPMDARLTNLIRAIDRTCRDKYTSFAVRPETAETAFVEGRSRDPLWLKAVFNVAAMFPQCIDDNGIITYLPGEDYQSKYGVKTMTRIISTMAVLVYNWLNEAWKYDYKMSPRMIESYLDNSVWVCDMERWQLDERPFRDLPAFLWDLVNSDYGNGKTPAAMMCDKSDGAFMTRISRALAGVASLCRLATVSDAHVGALGGVVNSLFDEAERMGLWPSDVLVMLDNCQRHTQQQPGGPSLKYSSSKYTSYEGVVGTLEAYLPLRAPAKLRRKLAVDRYDVLPRLLGMGFDGPAMYGM